MTASAHPKLAVRPFLRADAPLLGEIFRGSIEELAAEAELHDLSGLEAEFTDLERRLAVDRELEAMKREGQGEG